MSFAVPVEGLPDGRLRVYAAQGLVRAAGTATVSIVPITSEQQGDRRPFHAKILNLSSDDWCMVLIGSSNFTAAGLGVRGGGNLEANLLYAARKGSPEERVLDALWPETDDPLDHTSPSIVWDPRDEQQEPGMGEPYLPTAFKEALFIPIAPATLRIILADGLPAEWRISVPGGDVILSAGATAAGIHDVAWLDRPTPFVLQVEWRGTDARLWATSWAVNVADPAALPPPDELRSLRLEDLLEVLASTRPIAHAVARVLERRNRKNSSDIELDPHRRVDTHAFLLQRTRRVGAALDRLRERLEHPVLTREALDWRSRGAVGPVALADAFAREHRALEARFFLAEVALRLCRVRVSKAAAGGLSGTVIRSAIRRTINDVEQRVRALPASDDAYGVDSYVEAAMAEARL